MTATEQNTQDLIEELENAPALDPMLTLSQHDLEYAYNDLRELAQQAAAALRKATAK